MTAAAVHSEVVGPPRHSWRVLLWIMPLTLLWTLLIYWQPIISARGVPTTAVRLIDVWAHRGRYVARPRKHRPDVGPTPQRLSHLRTVRSLTRKAVASARGGEAKSSTSKRSSFSGQVPSKSTCQILPNKCVGSVVGPPESFPRLWGFGNPVVRRILSET